MTATTTLWKEAGTGELLAASGLHERHDALASLFSLYGDSLEGETRLAVVSGPVGSGKATLLRMFAERVTGSGALYLSADASRSERSIPFGVLAQFLRNPEIPSQIAHQAAALLNEVSLATGGTAAAETGARTGPEVPPLLFHRMCMLLLDLAQRTLRPLVIGVNDAQDADLATLRCLSFLTRRLQRGGLLTVLNHAIQSEPLTILFEAEMPAEPILCRISLPLLTPRGVEAMLAEHFGRMTARRLATDAFAVSGGNPLLVNGLIEDNRTPGGNGPAALAVGASFDQALLSCLYRCGQSTLEVARGIAILGDSATSALLSPLVGMDTHSAQRTIWALDETGVLAGGRFRHAAAKAAVLASLTAEDRTNRHTRAADVLYRTGASNTEVAKHLLAAERTPPCGVPLLRSAAEQALADGDVDLALRCLRLAYLGATAPDEHAATVAMIVRVGWRSDPHLTTRHLPDLAEAARHGHLMGSQVLALIQSMLWFGQTEQVRGLLTEVVGNPDMRTPSAAAYLEASRLWLHSAFPGTAGQMAAGGPDGTDRSGIGEEAPSAVPVSVSPSLDVAKILSELTTQGPSPALVDRAERLLRAHRLGERSVSCLVTALLVLIVCDRLSTAEQWCESLCKQDEAANAPTWQAQFAALRAEIYLRRGNMRMAEHYAHIALTLLPPRSWGVAVGVPLSVLIQATAALGQCDEARRYLEIPVPDAMFETPVGLRYLQARSRYHLADGQFHSALEGFLTIGELAGRWGMDLPSLLPWRTDAAQACLALGLEQRAWELATEQLARCDATSASPRARADTLRVLAASSGPAERSELLRQAFEVLQECDDRRQLAHPQFDLGWLRQVSAEPSAAEAAEDSGAVQSAVLEQVPLGADMAHSELEAVDGAEEAEGAVLSTAELRVASLAAHGFSNREIAGKLYVTISTVEQHLTRTYRKLRVRRSELPLALRRVTHRTSERSAVRSGPVLGGHRVAEYGNEHPA
ncbi:helix-turn-helix transcriptional regulator [Streptomyces sp. MZ04]|uniref:helix-turn-helix transcriptional regulator n=1 Tax=Streptomyces sp. MZ04 TaxID=2559236 RepID=UPI0014330870|nr:helix-turn-helix transcriptional regulator [Streptomyces sp. MZ04]